MAILTPDGEARPKWSLPPAHIRYLDLDGVGNRTSKRSHGRPLRIRTSVRGQGQPLLLIMGIGASFDLWEPLEHILTARGIQTIAFDLPGVGDSPPPVPPRRMRGLARITGRVLDELGYDAVDVLGVSYGGALAQQLACQAPARVRRLVLSATAPGLGGIPGRPGVLVHLATPLRYWSPTYARRVAPKIYGGRARQSLGGLLTHPAARLEHPPSLYGYLTQLYAGAGWSSVPWLHRIRQPTLVLTGDDDPIIPVANGRILARLIPNARLEVIRGGGHLFLLDQLEEASEHILSFLTPERGHP